MLDAACHTILGLAIWQFVLHNWALISTFLVIALLILIPVIVLRKYVLLTFNIIRDTPPPLSMGPRDFEPILGEVVHFRAMDGLSLRGMFLPTTALNRKGIIIFVHEFASDMYSCARYCRPLIAAGYDVFTFDFREHGGSGHEDNYTPRQWATNHEMADMLGAIAYVEDWLEERHLPTEIGLFGISRGACCAILAAQDYPRVACIVADGAFSTDRILEHLMKRWAYIFAKVRFVYENHPPVFWRFLRYLLLRRASRKLNCQFPSVHKALKRMAPRPILFIHGQRDSYLPLEQVQLLFDAAKQPKELWVVAGAKHNQAVTVQPEEYARRTIDFFDRYLAGIAGRIGPVKVVAERA
jgi:pimeloyl-ACP methyl ester carboxylesterase